MANEENLTPFQPGQCGNPNGRPKGKSFKTILEELLELQASDEDYSNDDIKKIFGDKRVTNREILMAKLLIKAKSDAESKAMERLMNRVDGKPIETVNSKVEVDTIKKINISLDGKDIDLSK